MSLKLYCILTLCLILSAWSLIPLAAFADGKCGQENNFFTKEKAPEMTRAILDIEQNARTDSKKLIIPFASAGKYRINDPLTDHHLKAPKKAATVELKDDGLTLEIFKNPAGQAAIKTITVSKPGYATQEGVQVGDVIAKILDDYQKKRKIAPAKTAVDKSGHSFVRYRFPGISFLVCTENSTISEIRVDDVANEGDGSAPNEKTGHE